MVEWKSSGLRKYGNGHSRPREPTHQIKINTVIHQIIHPRLDPFWRTEIDSVCFAYLPDLLPGASETEDGRVELRKIGLQHRGRVTGRIAGDEQWEEA